MRLKQLSCRWCFRVKRTERHNRRHQVKLQREDDRRPSRGQDEKGHKKGHENVPFWVFDGFTKTSASSLERMAGTTGLEPATSAVTGQRSRLDYWKYTARIAQISAVRNPWEVLLSPN